jgi:hypothetical protein
MRRRRSELEAAVSKCVIDSVIETNPKLRDVIRDVLDKGATPAEVKRRFGLASQRRRRYDHDAYNTALTVDWIVDEWERDKGLVKPDESIDAIHYD